MFSLSRIICWTREREKQKEKEKEREREKEREGGMQNDSQKDRLGSRGGGNAP